MSCETGACATKACDKFACSTNACPTTTLTAATSETAACATSGCQAAACDKSACCQTQCAKNACHKAECGQTVATAVATASDTTTAGDDGATPGMRKCFELNSHEATMVTSAERLDHLQRAAEHLAAAGCEKEAACVAAWATEVKQDLATHMREVSQMMKEAAAELEDELKSEATDKTTSAPATGEPVAAACSTKACDKMAVCDKPACKAACSNVDIATAKRCELPKSCDSQPVCGTSVKVVEVNLTLMRKLGIHLPGAVGPTAGKSSAKSIITDPAALQELLSVLERNGAARDVNVEQILTDSDSTFQIKRPESFSHVQVHTTCLEGDVLQVAIQPCPSDVHIPVPEYAEIGHTYCELDATVQMPRGKTAVLGAPCFQKARSERRVGLTTSETICTFEDCQILFIVTSPAAEHTSAVKQVGHSEPTANQGASACPTGGETVVQEAAKNSCEKSACQRTCRTASTSCDSAHTPACHVATGVAASTCPLTSDAQLFAACAAAKTCTATAACNNDAACETAACTATACGTAQACDQTLICPQTSFLSEAIATDAPVTTNSAAECCGRGKCCGQDACCKQGNDTAMVMATDNRCATAACSTKRCLTEACPDDPCVANSDAGCLGVIACDTGVRSSTACNATAASVTSGAHVATGSYLELHLSHLKKAAEHLAHAGLAEEAASVNVIANNLRQELITAKQGQIAGLEAEIAALEADCDAMCRAPSADSAMAVPVCPPPVCAEQECDSPVAMPPVPVAAPVHPAPPLEATPAHSTKAKKQILLKVKVVEVSMSRLHKLGFGLAAIQPGASVPGEGLASLLEALQRENAVKVLAEPSVVLANGSPASYHVGGSVALPKPGGKPGECTMHEIGTRLDAVAMMLDDHRVRVEIRPRVAELQTFAGHGPGICVREVDTGFDTELGTTVILGGLLQERMLTEKDSSTLEDRQVHDQRQLFFLVTPCAMDADTAVQPVSHAEPIAR